MKTLASILGATAIGLVMASSAATAQEMKFFRIGTGGAGGTYFPIGGIIANAIQTLPVRAPAIKAATAASPD